MSAGDSFNCVQTINHDGKVVLFGENTGKLRYKVLDLEQVADQDNPNAWDDNTRWTEWMDVPYPEELRVVGMSMLTIKQRLDHEAFSYKEHKRVPVSLLGWQVLSEAGYLYLFRAIDLGLGTGPRVYANRYTIIREQSPTGGTNRAAGGKALNVPQLQLVFEPRYRRSHKRETPESDTDGQGFLDMEDRPFYEPTMEFSMLAPQAGRFAVGLAPSAIPGRKRWQFVWQQDGTQLAALSLLRDEDGWADLEEKMKQANNRFNHPDDRGKDAKTLLLPDQLFTIIHSQDNIETSLALCSRPELLLFRRQEENAGLTGQREQALSPQRVMLAGSFQVSPDKKRVVVVDFDLDDQGIADIPQKVNIGTVDFARTALHLDSTTDAVTLKGTQPVSGALSFQAWIRYNEGKGRLIQMGNGTGFQVELKPEEKEPLQVTLNLAQAPQAAAARPKAKGGRSKKAAEPEGDDPQPVVLKAQMPALHSWQHIALVCDPASQSAGLYVNGQAAQSAGLAQGFNLESSSLVIGGGDGDGNALDFDIDEAALWNEARLPADVDIFREHSASDLSNSLVDWNFDDPESPVKNLVIDGAEYINQTAPIFADDAAEYQYTYGPHSVGMGLINEDLGDPRLFVSADGLIHLYSARGADQQLVSLQYDTTSTRAQFSFPWEANGETGELILVSRLTGLIMNRTLVEMEDCGNDHLQLSIHYPLSGQPGKPNGSKVSEVWANLPVEVNSLIAILNGQAADQPSAGEPDPAQVVYDYGSSIHFEVGAEALTLKELALMLIKGQTTPGIETIKESHSALYAWLQTAAKAQSGMAAFVTVSTPPPNNGALAKVQIVKDSTTPEAQIVPARRRQLGNFGGWIRAPKPVVGNFFAQNVLAKVDLTNDAFSRLQGLGDFALEAWVRPNRVPDQKAADQVGENRILNMNGRADTDKFALGLVPTTSLVIKDIPAVLVPDHPLLDSTTGTRDKLLDDGSGFDTDEDGKRITETYNESFTIGLTFTIPAKKDQDGSLFQLISEGGSTIFYAEADNGNLYFKAVDLRKWLTYSVCAPFPQSESGSLISAYFVWKIGSSSRMQIYFGDDKDHRAEVEVERLEYKKLIYLKLGKPDPILIQWIQILNNIVGAAASPNVKHNIPMRVSIKDKDCQLGLSDLRVWDLVLTRGERSAGNLPLRDLQLYWDFNDLKPGVSQLNNKVTAPVRGRDMSGWKLTLPPAPEKAHGYQVVASVGERRVKSSASIPAEHWAHVAMVCTGNHALQFNGVNQRAIIKDSSGMNVDKAFSLDCSLRWDGWADGQNIQYILSRSNLAESDMVFQLGLRRNPAEQALAVPFLRFKMTNANGEEVIQDFQNNDVILQPGSSYHLVARCALVDTTLPDEKATPELPANYQAWQIDAGVWLKDIQQAWKDQPDQPRVFVRMRANAGIVDADNNLVPVTQAYFITEKNKINSRIGLRRSEVKASIGSLSAEGEVAGQPNQGWFKGVIGHVRFWSQRLDSDALMLLPLTAGLPAGVPKPAAEWQLEENRGLEARDAAGGMTATLSDETMWLTTRLTSQISLYIDGLTTQSISDTGKDMKYDLLGKENAFTLGGFAHGGYLDEIRLWNDLLTQEEIYDSRHTLLGGSEDRLAGYWPIASGSGKTIRDASGNGNHALLSLAGADILKFWQLPKLASTGLDDPAPVANELPQVLQLVGGLPTDWVKGGAVDYALAEYGDTQIDANGRPKAIMKRYLAYLKKTGEVITHTGFKVGDLDLIYVGQAQSAPTLIGFVEGAPPVPSENMTRPFYLDPNGYNTPDGAASVQLLEAENTAQTFSTERNSGTNELYEIGGGFSLGAEHDTGVALGAFAATKITKVELKAGLKLEIESNHDWISGAGAEIETNRSRTNKIGTVGDWERSQNIQFKDLGRRYLYNNLGYALVKSGVANVFTMQMRQTGAFMGLTMIPDPEIREDYNIIMFPISPTYTKQGVLDGRVGYATDEDFQAADPLAASYYRPREANNLARQIEAYEARIAANYYNFNAGPVDRNEAGGDFEPGSLVMPFDWERQISKRNMVNTYVWTAGGGLFTERQETSLVKEESLGGAYGFKRMIGVATEGEVLFAGFGFNWDIKALWGSHVETQIKKTKREGRNFGMEVELNVDGFLRKYTGDSNQLYTTEDVPGKVKAYRFKTFYLVPDKKNFEEFWQKVVDQRWLASDDPDAQALRSAKGNTNQVWRVLHRVTYVSRVPLAKGQSLPAEVKPGRAVIHQVPNLAAINLVIDRLPNLESLFLVCAAAAPKEGAKITSLRMGPDQRELVGEAVAEVAGKQFADSIPWWQSYQDEANTNPNSAAAIEYREIKLALYDYMLAYIESGAVCDNSRVISLEDQLEPTPRWHDDAPDKPTTLADLAARAGHLYTFGEKCFSTDLRSRDDIELSGGAQTTSENPLPGCQGKLLLEPGGEGQVALTQDWGRDGDRTWEVVFRRSGEGSRLLFSPAADVPAAQRFLEACGVNEKGLFYVQPGGSGEAADLFKLDPDKTCYLALCYLAGEQKLEVHWKVQAEEGEKPQVGETTLDMPAGWVAGGWLVLGASPETLPVASLEIDHLAIYSGTLDMTAMEKRHVILQLN